MKLDEYKCDRCGKTYDYRQCLQGISSRCVEREWDVCDSCLTDFHAFMENK